MSASPRVALTGAFLGSLAVVGVFGLLLLIGQIPKAPFVAQWQDFFGGGWVAATLLGGAAFVIIGTLWGLPFAWVSDPTIPKAMAYAVLPTLWALGAWPALNGQPVFAGGDPVGILVPVGMNVVIWGSLLGWYTRQHTAPVAA